MSDTSRWLHPDEELAPHLGVRFELRYVGSIPIRVSIKSVDLETRTKIAHAAINRISEDVGLKLSASRSLDKLMSPYLGSDSNKNLALTPICLTITSQQLTVESLNPPRSQLFQHSLSMVSFASAGDSSSPDLFCYVAKDGANQRLCYAFDCPVGVAQEVITTLGQAFQLGFLDFQRTKLPVSKHPTASSEETPHPNNGVSGTTTANPFQASIPPTTKSSGFPTSPSSLAFDNFANFDDNTWLLNEPNISTSMEEPQAPGSGAPFTTSVPSCDKEDRTKIASNVKPLEPVGEPWYVGTMSRKEAERLLRYEGDFLVRASAQQPGQFVLSGLQDNKCRHLLLADPKGQVRTRERVFESIQHLIDYHVQNGVPIRSGDSEIRLIFPVSAQNLFEF